MDDVRWKCIWCRKVLKAPAIAMGQNGHCKRCRHAQVMPSVESMELDHPYGVADTMIDEAIISKAVSDISSKESNKPGSPRPRFAGAWEIRNRAAYWLWNLDRKELFDGLLALFSDNDVETKCVAIDALREIGNEEVGKSLLAQVGKAETDAEIVRVHLAEAIETVLNEEAAEDVFANKSARAEAERRSIRDRADYGLSSSSGPHYGALQWYRRTLRAIQNSGKVELPLGEKISCHWYAGRFGLAIGVSAETCLKYFAAGVALSPPKDHAICDDHHSLRYCLALLNNNTAEAAEIRKQAEEIISRNRWVGEFARCVHGIVRNSRCLPNGLLADCGPGELPV